MARHGTRRMALRHDSARQSRDRAPLDTAECVALPLADRRCRHHQPIRLPVRPPAASLCLQALSACRRRNPLAGGGRNRPAKICQPSHHPRRPYHGSQRQRRTALSRRHPARRLQLGRPALRLVETQRHHPLPSPLQHRQAAADCHQRHQHRRLRDAQPADAAVRANLRRQRRAARTAGKRQRRRETLREPDCQLVHRPERPFRVVRIVPPRPRPQAAATLTLPLPQAAVRTKPERPPSDFQTRLL